MNKSKDMQGEGNYDAAREFNEAERKFVESGKVEQAARDAEPKSDAEADELAEAEQAGRSHAKGKAGDSASPEPEDPDAPEPTDPREHPLPK
jgi:hypothetical protein